MYFLLDLSCPALTSWIPFPASWEAQCLYRIGVDSPIAELAPHLVSVSKSETLVQYLDGEVRSHAWGIVILAHKNASLLKRHLRKFLIVGLPDGRRMYFRFYDPRVLRHFLPTCTSEQLTEFFGPIRAFAIQGDAEGDWIVFRLLNDRLHTAAARGLTGIVDSASLC